MGWAIFGPFSKDVVWFFSQQHLVTLLKSIVQLKFDCVPDQLQEVRKVSLASLICLNMEDIYAVQPEVFIQNDPYL
jgi:hypothetical protein